MFKKSNVEGITVIGVKEIESVDNSYPALTSIIENNAIIHMICTRYDWQMHNTARVTASLPNAQRYHHDHYDIMITR
jgi:hypothetical protein